MKKTFFMTILGILLFACGTYQYQATYLVKTIQNEFDKYTINRMFGNILGGGGTEASVALNAQRYQSKDGKILYSLIVFYVHVHRKWLFIKEGESLVLLVDGQRMGFTGRGSSHHREVRNRGGVVLVREMAWYDVSLQDLKRIANAKEVKVRITGSQYYIVRHFTQKNFENLRRFVEEYGGKKVMTEG